MTAEELRDSRERIEAASDPWMLGYNFASAIKQSELDALRAENKALKTGRVAEIFDAGFDNRATELDTLRADNESLRLTAGSLDELNTRLMSELTETEQALAAADAENERLRGLVDQWYEIANRLQGVETENERLRADVDNVVYAWQKIGDAPNGDIRGLARAHLATVLNELLAKHKRA